MHSTPIRVARRVKGDQAEGLTISTFHSLGLRFLQLEHARAGLRRGFSIFDADDQLDRAGRGADGRPVDRLERRHVEDAHGDAVGREEVGGNLGGFIPVDPSSVAWARFPGRWSEGQLLWLGTTPRVRQMTRA